MGTVDRSRGRAVGLGKGEKVGAGIDGGGLRYMVAIDCGGIGVDFEG